MSMNAHELDAESAELLPGREALGKLKFSFSRTTSVTKHIANVHAHNESLAVNDNSPLAVAQSEAAQSISIKQ
ncbi:hypothetical protein [Streptomyces hesseae]|uniref:FXSXX-COOH protein n=1 Tax=Streptomyces hesseae TaxID=3075519 RepID=A0ABU2SR82_9ACTN|nr:hypothetical protein [Streptomyces sp. DSM 40473]MDT0451402.1 hypothetical protein [Streptomyces sp. DSM 40473]